MKRLVALLTVLCMMLCVVPAMAETATGTGTAKGYANGDVTVTITLTDGVITDAKATGVDQTAGIGEPYLTSQPEKMVKGNTINVVAVDAKTGATMTNNAILAAARLALENAGVNPDDYMTEYVEAAEDAVYDVDVVIVGAGGAGMVSALTAAEYGAKVIVVESQAAVGGNSVRATGGMNAGDTPTQDTNTFGENAGVEAVLKNAAAYADNAEITELAGEVSIQWEAYQKNPEGYFDSEELMQLDTLIGGKGVNDPELVETLAEDSSEGVEWLKKYDIDLSNVGAFGGASVKRIHRPVNAEGKTVSVGAYMIPRLETACENNGITILKETTATEILMADGKAVGIVCTGKSGNTVTINAKAVILASGGFGANLEMVASYKPELEGFMTTNAAGIQGQGIAMAEKVGAATVDMEQIQIHPTVQFDTAALITEGLRGDGAILVNAEGKRFIDEVGTRDVVSAAEIAQTGSYSWLIVDDAMLQKSSVIAGYKTKGFMFEGATYEELAAKIGVPAEDFAATMNAWNACVAEKNDPDFGRVSFANPLDTAPFYAIKVTAGVHHTMGGVKINDDTEVIDVNGKVIPGLYAAGEITGGVHGANRLGGNAVSDFVVFGRIAGEEAAELALGLDD
ncbi:MAG: flavocytochrome c [Clostridia bacterium]|nr:flavocytochrome c [Clostridia bacterium]